MGGNRDCECKVLVPCPGTKAMPESGPLAQEYLALTPWPPRLPLPVATIN